MAERYTSLLTTDMQPNEAKSTYLPYKKSGSRATLQQYGLQQPARIKPRGGVPNEERERREWMGVRVISGAAHRAGALHIVQRPVSLVGRDDAPTGPPLQPRKCIAVLEAVTVSQLRWSCSRV